MDFNLPPDIEAVNEKVMAKERDKRYRSGLEFANAFIAALPEGFAADVSFVSPLPLPAKTEPKTLVLPAATETSQRRFLDRG